MAAKIVNIFYLFVSDENQRTRRQAFDLFAFLEKSRHDFTSLKLFHPVWFDLSAPKTFVGLKQKIFIIFLDLIPLIDLNEGLSKR
jgi:hypothetical protein